MSKYLDMALNLRLRIIERLQTLANPKPPASWPNGYSPAFRKCAAKKAASGARLQSDADLLQQLVAEIGSQRPHWQAKHPQLKTHESRPRRYYWTELDAAAEVAAAEGVADPQAECTPVNEAVGEHALYPVLADYLRSEELGVWAMRINERRSSSPSGQRRQ